jgi:alpha-mannosidase
LSALKKSESGEGLILRVYDTAGKRADTAVELFGQKRRFREVNLLEEDVAPSDGDVLQVGPFEIKTVKLTVDARAVR